jgi:hypothetical protein
MEDVHKSMTPLQNGMKLYLEVAEKLTDGKVRYVNSYLELTFKYKTYIQIISVDMVSRKE